jgi:hypothetical protein
MPVVSGPQPLFPLFPRNRRNSRCGSNAQPLPSIAHRRERAAQPLRHSPSLNLPTNAFCSSAQTIFSRDLERRCFMAAVLKA